QLLSLADTPYYHCISRCVRRAFLCGNDALTGSDFSHRRAWLVRRMRYMEKSFAIDVCAYAIMSNHYHLVLRINLDLAIRLTDRQVVERWGRLYRIPPWVRSHVQNLDMTDSLREKARSMIALWRKRLADLSWYMRTLNEY